MKRASTTCPTDFGNAGNVAHAYALPHHPARGGRVDSTSITFTGSPEEERAIRRHERKMLGELLQAAITEKQHVALQHALRKLDPETARTCGTIIHLLASTLASVEEQGKAA